MDSPHLTVNYELLLCVPPSTLMFVASVHGRRWRKRYYQPRKAMPDRSGLAMPYTHPAEIGAVAFLRMPCNKPHWTLCVVLPREPHSPASRGALVVAGSALSN